MHCPALKSPSSNVGAVKTPSYASLWRAFWCIESLREEDDEMLKSQFERAKIEADLGSFAASDFVARDGFVIGCGWSLERCLGTECGNTCTSRSV